MLNKKMLLKIIIITVVYMSTSTTLLCSTSVENINTDLSVNLLDIIDNEYNNKVTDEEYKSIQKILEYINNELKEIESKIDEVRTLPEYEKYPAVRLNIDTPYFGIYSIINSKLKIRKDVSTVDIASGYKIKDIVDKKIIKIESFEVSNIVVITRDLKISNEMTSADAQISIVKLLEYLNQAKSVNDFLDKQLTKIITEYFSKEKLEYLSNINDEIKEIEENLYNISMDLSYIKVVTENDLTNDIEILYQYKDNIKVIESQIKNPVISELSLEEVYENIKQINTDVKEYKLSISKIYTEITSNISVEQVMYLINLNINKELDYLKNYINNAKIEIDSSDIENNEDIQKEYKDIYIISSDGIVENMEKDLEVLNDMLYEYVKLKISNEEVEKEEINEEEMLEDLLKIYISFLNKENVFLTENVKINIEEIKKINDIDISLFEDIEYIYIYSSDVLTNISDDFESSSIISNIKTSDRLKEVIEKVLLCNENFKKEEN